MTRALLLALIALMLCGFAAPADPYDTQPVIRAMAYDGVDVKVEWRFCGQPNGFYDPVNRRVIMCNELRTFKPGLIRYILAHELAHAIIMQRDVPYTTSHEGAADELGALTLIWMGRSADVVEGAEFWVALGRPENPQDDHFGDHRRAYSLLCLSAGQLLPLYTECGATYARATKTWVRLLEMDK